MKKYRYLMLFCSLIFSIAVLAPACRTKSGCEMTESLQAPINKKGEIKKSKRAKSGLFPKNMSKRMK